MLYVGPLPGAGKPGPKEDRVVAWFAAIVWGGLLAFALYKLVACAVR